MTGHGSMGLPKEEAQNYANQLNKDHPSINHWTEPIETKAAS
jgi:hypothetical protein